MPLGLAGDLGHPATALSGPHLEFEALLPEPTQPFSIRLLSRLMYREHLLGAADGLIGQIEQPVEIAEVEIQE